MSLSHEVIQGALKLAEEMAEYILEHEWSDFKEWCEDQGLDPDSLPRGHIYSTACRYADGFWVEEAKES